MQDGLVLLLQPLLDAVLDPVYPDPPLPVLPALGEDPQRPLGLRRGVIHVPPGLGEQLHLPLHGLHLLLQLLLPEADVLVPLLEPVLGVQLILLGVVLVLLNQLRREVPQSLGLLPSGIGSGGKKENQFFSSSIKICHFLYLFKLFMFHSEGENSVLMRFFLRFDFIPLWPVSGGESWDSLTECCLSLLWSRGVTGCRELRGVCAAWSRLSQVMIAHISKITF